MGRKMAGSYGSFGPEGLPGSALPQSSTKKVIALVAGGLAVVMVLAVAWHQVNTRPMELISEWDIDTDNSPVRIAQSRKHITSDLKVQARGPALKGSKKGPALKAGRKEMLMYGHVDLPTENFSWKWDSGAPSCEGQCAFRDKVFTVEGFDQLCLQHCGEIDEMLKANAKKQKNLVLATFRRQQLAEEPLAK